MYKDLVNSVTNGNWKISFKLAGSFLDLPISFAEHRECDKAIDLYINCKEYITIREIDDIQWINHCYRIQSSIDRSLFFIVGC